MTQHPSRIATAYESGFKCLEAWSCGFRTSQGRKAILQEHIVYQSNFCMCEHCVNLTMGRPGKTKESLRDCLKLA